MKRLLIVLSLITLTAFYGWAGTILITFDNPAQTGNPGDTLVFTGILSNGGINPIFFNSDTLNLVGNGFVVTDLFFSTVPISLNPGQSSASIALFNVTLLNPFTDPVGSYPGTYSLVGGIDSNAQDTLGSADFTATAGGVPEPSSIALLTAGLVALVSLHRRKQSHLDEK